MWNKLLTVTIFLLVPLLVWGTTVTYDEASEFTANIETSLSSDYQVKTDGVRIREYDTANDFQFISKSLAGHTFRTASTNENVVSSLPSGVTGASARHVQITASQSVPDLMSVYFSNKFGPKAALLQPTSMTMYIKTANHSECDVPDDGYYPWTYYLMGGRNTILIPWYDCHDSPRCGKYGFYNANNALDWFNFGVTDFGPTNNGWDNYLYEFDWSNHKTRLTINGQVVTPTSSPINYVESSPYAGLDGINSGGYANMFPINYTGNTYQAHWISDITERLADTLSIVPWNHYYYSETAKWRLGDGVYVANLDRTSLSGTVNSATLSWTTGVATNSVVTALYGAAVNTDVTKISADSTETDYAAADVLNYTGSTDQTATLTNGWQSANTSGTHTLTYDFSSLSSVPVIKFCGIYPGLAYESGTALYDYMVPTSVTVQGSNNGTNWTDLGTLSVPTTHPDWATSYNEPSGAARGQAPVVERMYFVELTSNSTAYNYIRLSMNGSSYSGSNANKILGWELREAADAHTSAEWAYTTIQTRVSNDAGSNWSSWSTLATSGASIPNITPGVSKDNIRIQAKAAFHTGNQKYQPYISTLSFDIVGGAAANITGSLISGSTCR